MKFTLDSGQTPRPNTKQCNCAVQEDRPLKGIALRLLLFQEDVRLIFQAEPIENRPPFAHWLTT
ncbi:hypothetical protein ACU6VI_13750 [Sphaerotilus natans]|uniref:hypothetical protein n=1 Tax=Sphaerotilus natans TaxID=34103 RepID=UPI00406D4415